MRNPAIARMRRLCIRYFRMRNLCLLTSSHVRNPIPPTMIRVIMTRLISGCPENEVSDENGSRIPMRSNPALQKADTEWNTPYHTPLKKPNCPAKTGIIRTAPKSSAAAVPLRIMPVRFRIPPISCAETDSCMRLFCRMLIFLPEKRITATETVITPMPPIWISTMITNCPKLVNVLGTSIVVRPVTQTALVVVNSESIHERCTPGWMQRGISSTPEPTRMITMKLTASIRAGLVFLPKEVVTAFDSSIKEMRNRISRWNPLLSRILITPMVSSMLKNSTKIGISVSVNKPLMPHPKRL